MMKYKLNWCLYLGGLLLSLSLLLIMFSNDFNQDLVNSSRNPSNIPILLFSVFAIIVSPILEEVAFRGYFTNKKYVKKVAIVLLVLFILISYKNILAVSFILGLLVSILVNKSTRTTIVLAALGFASVHFSNHDEFSFSILNQFLVYFSSSLILIWVTMNFGLKRSILIHALLNASLLIVQLIYLQFPDQNIQIYTTSRAAYKIQRVPFFSSQKSTIAFHKNNVSISKMNLRNVYELLHSKTAKEMFYVKEYEPYMKYDIKVNFTNEDMEITEIREEIIRFLEHQKFIFMANE